MSGSSREQVWDVFANSIQTFDEKNADYGDAWRRNGWRGNLSRVFEKSDRVRNLVWRPDPRVPAVGDETAVETLQDMLNTIAFALINLKEEVEWGHEVPRSKRLDMIGADYVPGQVMHHYEAVAATIPHGATEPVRTEVISQDAVRQAVHNGGVPQGSDEVRTTEAEKSGHVPRKPRQKAVTDNPQA